MLVTIAKVGVSLNQYRALATHLNEMQEYFEIIGVNLNVLIA